MPVLGILHSCAVLTALGLCPCCALVAHGAVAAVQKLCKGHHPMLITVEWPRVSVEMGIEYTKPRNCEDHLARGYKDARMAGHRAQRQSWKTGPRACILHMGRSARRQRA